MQEVQGSKYRQKSTQAVFSSGAAAGNRSICGSGAVAAWENVRRAAPASISNKPSEFIFIFLGYAFLDVFSSLRLPCYWNYKDL